MADLRKKSVLVTGGSRGIGAAIAKAVGAAGGQVIVNYARNRDAAEAIQQSIGRDHCHVLQADLTFPDEVDRLWSDTLAIAPRLDVLINNAGLFEAAPVETSVEQWRETWLRVLQVNLLAPADLCRAAIQHFRDIGGGKIINVASRAAFRGEALDQMPYGASKGALVALTKTIAPRFCLGRCSRIRYCSWIHEHRDGVADIGRGGNHQSDERHSLGRDGATGRDWGPSRFSLRRPSAPLDRRDLRHQWGLIRALTLWLAVRTGRRPPMLSGAYGADIWSRHRVLHNAWCSDYPRVGRHPCAKSDGRQNRLGSQSP